MQTKISRSLFLYTIGALTVGAVGACDEETKPDLEMTQADTLDPGLPDADTGAPLVQILARDLEAADHEAARRGFDDAVQGARWANIDIDALNAELKVGREIEFPLPDGDRAMLVIETVAQLLPGITSFSGHLGDDENADFTFSIEAGKLIGSIRRDEYTWLVEPHAGSDAHLIRLVDRSMLPGGELELRQQDDAGPEGPAALAGPLPTSTVMANGNVRVLFLYASNVASPSAKATNIVTAFNKSLQLSAVAANNYLTVAGVQPVASSFIGQSRLTIMNSMIARSAPFAAIDAARTSTYADIVFLLVSEDPTANDMPAPYGRVAGVASMNVASPFALSTSAYALGDLTALHEIGHVLGGQHENVASAGIARPRVAPDKTWMTIMGGYIDCEFTGIDNPTCIRLNRWSNPAQTYLNVPLGVPGERDMESWLEARMPIVSQYQPEPPPPLLPLMAVYNNVVHDYLYSTDKTVINAAIANYGYDDLIGPLGSFRTVGFVEGTLKTNTAEFKRYWKGAPQTDHFYTTSSTEANGAIQSGWVWEPGYSAGYLYTIQVPGSVPLYRLNKFTAQLDGMHYYTASAAEVASMKASGFTLDGVAGYVHSTATPNGG